MPNANPRTMRVVSPSEFYRLFADLLAHFGDLVRASRSRRVSKAFSERIMLAVTQVNNCRYCNYYHTREALRAGVSPLQLQGLLEGDLSLAPVEEHAALLFAQHYAESGGHPHVEAQQHLDEVYGREMSRDIMAYVRMIMVGNAYGIMVDALRYRLMRRPLAESSLRQEVGVVFGVLFMLPNVISRQLIGAIFGRS